MQKTCRQCAQKFEITDEDLRFYDKVSPVFTGKKYSLPPPTLCPDCRQQRRQSWRNERKLYNRKCDQCKRQIISIYSPDKDMTVYCHKCWWSDKWDGKDYALEFDFTKPFFQQFLALIKKVPHLAMINNMPENSDYCNQTTRLKNSYLCFNANSCEDCLYCKGLNACRNVVDGLRVYDSELCYECTDTHASYNCSYLSYCVNCSDCNLLYDCIGCKNCFASAGLRNKEYYILNKAYSKKEYGEKMRKIRENPYYIGEYKPKFHELLMSVPHKYAQIVNSENCVGDSIYNSKNASNSFDVVGAHDVKYCFDLRGPVDNLYDIASIGNSLSFSYETVSTGINVRGCIFTDNVWENCSDIIYSSFCVHGSSQCFGSVGLKHAKYCIFNKQYTKEEYESICAKIIEHMKRTGEWGEFFPLGISPFNYNESLAFEFYPLNKNQVINMGAKWHDEDPISKYQGASIKPQANIDMITEDIIRQILGCGNCGKNYRIIAQELAFYKKMQIPLPDKCPNCRHSARMDSRNPRKLWGRKCAKCGARIKTTYAPDRPEIVYCESCYLKEVY
jgi:hypothetical protein